MVRLLIAFLASLPALSSAFADDPLMKEDAKPLPKEVVEAWVKAGATAGWMGVGSKSGYFEFDARYSKLRADYIDIVPGFRLKKWPVRGVEKLPAPNQPFCLDLDFVQLTDAEVKELTTFRTLTLLALHSTGLTDAGAKELASINSLTALHIGYTKVMDAGLKELIPLKNLTSLDLNGTKVTDIGVTEIATLKSLRSLHLYSTEVTDAGAKEIATVTPHPSELVAVGNGGRVPVAT